MAIAALKTWIAEILTPNDLNGEFTNNREYIKENKDMILGDNAEGTGFSGHNHNGTLGVQIAAAGLASDSVITAKILDANVTTAKIADDNVTTAKILDDNVTTAKILDDNITTAKILDANVTWAKASAIVQRYVLSQRLKNCELVYEDTNNVTVSFPWTEAAGTAWANVTGIDVSAETGSGGNVKEAVGANTASTWYYLYVSNTFTVGQPLVAEFLLTKVATGETGYTLIGAIYNNASQEIEPFDQFGKYVAWRTPPEILSGGTQEGSLAEVDCSQAIPAFSIFALSKLYLFGVKNGSDGDGTIAVNIQPKGGTIVYALRLYTYQTDAKSIYIVGEHKLVTDTSQKIEYQLYKHATGMTSIALSFSVTGYYVR